MLHLGPQNNIVANVTAVPITARSVVYYTDATQNDSFAVNKIGALLTPLSLVVNSVLFCKFLAARSHFVQLSHTYYQIHTPYTRQKYKLLRHTFTKQVLARHKH